MMGLLLSKGVPLATSFLTSFNIARSPFHSSVSFLVQRGKGMEDQTLLQSQTLSKPCIHIILHYELRTARTDLYLSTSLSHETKHNQISSIALCSLPHLTQLSTSMNDISTLHSKAHSLMCLLATAATQEGYDFTQLEISFLIMTLSLLAQSSHSQE